MPRCIEQMLIVLVLLLLAFDRSLTTNCMSISNQKCMVKPTLINLNPDDIHYYWFIVSPDRCDGSCNIVEDLFSRILYPNWIKDLNLKH